MAKCYRWEGPDLLIQLKLQPRTGQDEFVGPRDDRLRVRITAPPVEGKANSHLVAWLAKQFGVGKSSVAIEAGQRSQFKRARVRAPAQLPAFIAPPRSPRGLPRPDIRVYWQVPKAGRHPTG